MLGLQWTFSDISEILINQSGTLDYGKLAYICITLYVCLFAQFEKYKRLLWYTIWINKLTSLGDHYYFETQGLSWPQLWPKHKPIGSCLQNWNKNCLCIRWFSILIIPTLLIATSALTKEQGWLMSFAGWGIATLEVG